MANYAKDQHTGFTNRIEKVAIIGAGGRLGKHFAEELVKTGKHTVTALTRADSKSTFPAGVNVVRVNFEDEASLVAALKGQQFLVITLSVTAPPETHSNIVKAAAKAGVPYVMPNCYGNDVLSKANREDTFYGAAVANRVTEIETLGVSSYIYLVCGFWYEWSLALGPSWFGFDFKNKQVTFFDDGKTRMTISTWRQCGRALAGLLSLKELPDDANDKSPTISQWKNKPFYIGSFTISQRDILDSIHRVNGSKDSDWKIDYESTAERFKKGLEEMKAGDRTGFAKALYARGFAPEAGGDHESISGLDNSKIGLSKENIDEVTKPTLQLIANGWNPFAV